MNALDRPKAYLIWKEAERRLPRSLWVQEFRHAGVAPIRSSLVDRTIGSLWAWSGESPYPSDESYQKPIIQATGTMVAIEYRSCRERIHLLGRSVLDVRKPRLLDIGAITTFSVGGIPESLKSLAAHRIQNVDLFAFQNADLGRYYGVTGTASPLEIISAHPVPEKIAAQIAGDVVAIGRESDHLFSIRGFATYLPEVSSLVEEDRGKAVKALKNVIRIAASLRERHHFDARFIEMVAGTRLYNPRMEKASHDKTDPRTVVVARRASYADKQAALLKSLGELSQDAYDNNVWLAIEVEPGLLPFLATEGDVKSLLEQVETPGILPHPERIGINVDCCHMHLCGISAKTLSRDDIRHRISHVHIGDIGPGHLSDLVTGVKHDYSYYREWFDLFVRVATELPRPITRFPDFSCCLSVELEACRTPKMIASAYHRTKLLLERYLRERAYPWSQGDGFANMMT